MKLFRTRVFPNHFSDNYFETKFQRWVSPIELKMLNETQTR
jgi:hypothetical protein